MKTLKNIYKAQLQDAYSACKQSLDIIVKLASVAENKELSQSLIGGSNGITDGMDKLASLCSEHAIDPDGHHCKGMEGLVREAREHALDEDFDNSDTRDVMIITQYQRMAHYAIAAYGCLRTFANRLELDGDAAVLYGMLDSAYDGDRRLTAIATGKSGLNKEAAE